MKALRVLLPLAVAGVVVLVGIWQLFASRDAEGLRLEREVLRREMIERSVVARGLGGPQGAEEARAVVQWWLESVAALRNRYPRQAGQLDPARPAAKEKDKGKASEEQVWRAYAAERRDALRAGYAAALSAVDQGLRLDVLGVRAAEHPDTHERALRIDFALWGPPRRLERESLVAGAEEGARAARRVVVPVAFRQLAFRFADAGGKTYGEMTGAGEPYIVMKDPERFSGDLPPGIVLGTWWVEPFPREATRVEISVGVQVQGMTSAALAPTFRWELPVPEEWKLRPGEVFRAEAREAPPEPAPAAR